MSIILIILTVIGIVLAAFYYRTQTQDELSMSVERITFSIKDGVTIVGDYYTVAQPKGFVLFLHMMPAQRGSWATLARALQEKGIASLAIDFRGHGESIGGPDGYKSFSDAEQQKKRLDVEAAVGWLQEKGAREERLVLVGASIGANLAVEYAAAHSAIPGVALLSPGLDYRGVRTEPAARKLAPTQQLFLAASAPDDQESFNAIQVLARVTKAHVTKHDLTNLGHGTTMTDRDQKLLNTLVNWVNSLLQ